MTIQPPATGQAAQRYDLGHLARGAALYGGADLVVMAVRFVLLALYTRALQPADLGLLAVVYTTVVMASTLVPLGMPFALMIRQKQVTAKEATQLKDSTLALLLLLCAGVGLLCQAGVLVLPGTEDLRPIMSWLTLWGACTIVAFVPTASLRIEEKIVRYGLARIARIAVMAALVFYWYVVDSLGVRQVITAEALGALVELFLLFALDRYVPRDLSLGPARSLLALGVPLCAVSLGYFLIDLSDRYVIQWFMGAEATGYYATAARIAIAASFAAEAFNAMWTPYYYRLRGAGALSGAQFSRIFGRLALLAAAGVSFLMLALPPLVSLRVFGRPFIAARYHFVAPLVAPLVLSFFFKACFYLVAPPIEFSGRTTTLSRALYAGVAVNVAGNVAVATLLPGTGILLRFSLVAGMTSLAYLLCTVLCIAAIRRFMEDQKISIAGVGLAAAFLFAPFAPLHTGWRFALWTGLAATALGSWHHSRVSERQA